MRDEVERALQAAIRADPDDWQSWLVYGDWLTDRGDVRGQLIAWEHQLAVSTAGPLEPPAGGAMSANERRALRERIAKFEREHQEEWLPNWVPPQHVELHWRHGFIVGLTLTRVEALATLAVLAAHPAMELLCTLDLSGHGIVGARTLAAAPSLGPFTALKLTGYLGDEGARALADSAHLSGFTRLCLARTYPTDDGIRALVGSPHLRALAVLDLTDNGIYPAGARILAAADALRPLERLVLTRNNLGPAGARALAASASLGSLKELVLAGNSIGDEGRAVLAASPSLRGCRVIS